MMLVVSRSGGRLVGSRGGQLVIDCGGVREFVVITYRRLDFSSIQDP